MTLTRIQQDAIAKARRGDYSLLDAMELKHRLDHDGACHGYLVGGRLRLIAYGNGLPYDCNDCEGEGTVDCQECDDGRVDCDLCDADHTIEHVDCKGDGCAACQSGRIECDACAGVGSTLCDDCKGDSYVTCGNCEGEGEFPPNEFEDLRVENLDGRVLWREDDPAEPAHPCGWQGEVTRQWAETILDAYDHELRAAAKAAAVPAGPAGQTNIAMETA